MQCNELKWNGMDLLLTSCTSASASASASAAASGRGAGASKPTTAPKASRRGASSRRPTPGASPPTNSRTTPGSASASASSAMVWRRLETFWTLSYSSAVAVRGGGASRWMRA